MDYLQYAGCQDFLRAVAHSFKPCYKWITFNISLFKWNKVADVSVLNLVINGLPSIFTETAEFNDSVAYSFKPCYKWITFNISSIRV